MEEKQSYETQAYSLFIYLPATPSNSFANSNEEASNDFI